jgi:hypothetical protein
MIRMGARSCSCRGSTGATGPDRALLRACFGCFGWLLLLAVLSGLAAACPRPRAIRVWPAARRRQRARHHQRRYPPAAVSKGGGACPPATRPVRWWASTWLAGCPPGCDRLAGNAAALTCRAGGDHDRPTGRQGRPPMSTDEMPTRRRSASRPKPAATRRRGTTKRRRRGSGQAEAPPGWCDPSWSSRPQLARLRCWPAMARVRRSAGRGGPHPQPAAVTARVAVRRQRSFRAARSISITVPVLRPSSRAISSGRIPLALRMRASSCCGLLHERAWRSR